jgi:hypothetical protein
MNLNPKDFAPLRRQLGIGGAGRGCAAEGWRSKYGAVRTEIDGIKFDSKREACRYGELKMLKAAGEVKWFTMQVPFRLDGGTVYRADFLVVWKDGRVSIEDSKGMRTATYRIKKREVEAKYGIEIEEK